MPRLGRRPGNHDTKADILQAARACFDERGYDGTSLREIARRAGVDAALIHHYFGSKATLFADLMEIPGDPRQVAEEAAAAVDGSAADNGAAIVEGFLGLWERRGPDAPPPTHAFRATVEATLASPEAIENVKQFLADRVWSTIEPVPGDDERATRLRRALIASTLVGLGWVRYIIELDELAAADPDELAAIVGLTIDRYAAGPLTTAGPIPVRSQHWLKPSATTAKSPSKAKPTKALKPSAKALKRAAKASPKQPRK